MSPGREGPLTCFQ